MEVCWFGPAPRRFTKPQACFEAHTIDEVGPALLLADAALVEGYCVAGYLAYEAGEAFVPGATRALRDATDPATRALPLLALGVYAPTTDEDDARGEPDDCDRAEDSREARADSLGPLVAQIDTQRYHDDLEAIARALHAGDVYQVNYTVPFAFEFAGDPWRLFSRLRARANVPYAAYVRHGDRALLSLSPERFFELDGARVRARPMKGTATPDALGALDSLKNRAEHVMIVDLLRNDLHRICDRVDVAPLFEVEAYPTFATMTSTLDGVLRDDVRLRDIFAALFPCGSITGAPKRSAMNEIARRERAPRGIAMGTIGYCDGPRRGQWSVAIRTADLDCATGRGDVRIGGGIVADSNADSEWAEVLVKRRVFASDARAVGLIETLRIEPDGSLASEDAHRERLARSAFALGIPHDDARVAELFAALHRTTRHAPALVRIELGYDGTLTSSERDLGELPRDPTIALSPARVRSSDPTLAHKTTARDAYDSAAVFARAHGHFDALLANENGDLADGSRTTLFIEMHDGTLATPPLAAGALAGILRASLLASGRAREMRLVARDLEDAAALFVGNSARGLIAVRAIVSRKDSYVARHDSAVR